MGDELRLSARLLLGAVADRSDAPGPLSGFRALASAIDSAIRAGEIPAGARLPTERSLAATAGMSRGSVVAAYDLLREDGLVLRRQGSGTWVRASTRNDSELVPDAVDAALRARQLTARVLRTDPEDRIDLGLSALTGPWGLDAHHFDVPLDQLRTAGHGHGYLPNGIDELRAALAGDGPVDRVAITHGSQHAIALAARLLLHPGDTVVVERPTFPGAIDAFARAGARFATVPVDSGGVRVDALARLLDEGSVRAVYLVPSAQSPTGSVMSVSRRRAIAELIDRSECWLIEDETLAPLVFGGAPPPSIASFGRCERFLTLGSLSKQVWGGLRIGWLRAASETIDRLGRLRAATDLGASVHAQLVALRCLDGLEDRTGMLRTELAARAERLRALLDEHLPSWSAAVPAGGLSLWCELPEPSGDELAMVAPGFGVSVLPGSSTSPDPGFEGFVRLSFAAEPEVLEVGVERLTAAWRAVSAGAEP